MEYFGGGWFVSITVAIFLYIDAPKHKKEKWLWAILGLIFGLLALGVYLIKTNRKGIGWLIIIFSTIVYVILILLILVGIATFYVSTRT
ncbi:hypothetical protein [Bacillus sp. NPDC077027]|uniref:hypothetical protein n=1 Tax=Bacillus sp. NPDC077027 TaxID=3390548 RepID=UPI003CFDBD63